MIDAGLVYDAKTAIQRAKAFEPFDPFWFEEPLLPDDYEGYAKLAAATSLRIAAGEEESERKSFIQLMDVGQNRRRSGRPHSLRLVSPRPSRSPRWPPIAACRS